MPLSPDFREHCAKRKHTQLLTGLNESYTHGPLASDTMTLWILPEQSLPSIQPRTGEEHPGLPCLL